MFLQLGPPTFLESTLELKHASVFLAVRPFSERSAHMEGERALHSAADSLLSSHYLSQKPAEQQPLADCGECVERVCMCVCVFVCV